MQNIVNIPGSPIYTLQKDSWRKLVPFCSDSTGSEGNFSCFYEKTCECRFNIRFFSDLIWTTAKGAVGR